MFAKLAAEAKKKLRLGVSWTISLKSKLYKMLTKELYYYDNIYFGGRSPTLKCQL